MARRALLEEEERVERIAVMTSLARRDYWIAGVVVEVIIRRIWRRRRLLWLVDSLRGPG